MSELSEAVETLLASVLTEAGDPQQVQQLCQEVFDVLPQATAVECDQSLRRMSLAFPKCHPLFVGKLAITSGALVENGGDPHICGPVLIRILPDLLGGATQFLQRCRELAQQEGRVNGAIKQALESEEWTQKYFPRLLAETPLMSFAFLTHSEATLATMTHLTRSKALRAEARSLASTLLVHSQNLDQEQEGGRSFLTKLLLVLDDEPLLILDTDQYKGYWLRISGIPDNFGLHTALMGHLFGDPREGWIEAVNFDMDEIRYALQHPCDEQAPILSGAFTMWNWTAVQPDGLVPPPMLDTAHHWIFNEAIPADILTFEGTRIVILGHPGFPRSWRGGLIFKEMLPEVVVQEKLPESEVRNWFNRLGTAPKPPSHKKGSIPSAEQ